MFITIGAKLTNLTFRNCHARVNPFLSHRYLTNDKLSGDYQANKSSKTTVLVRHLSILILSLLNILLFSLLWAMWEQCGHFNWTWNELFELNKNFISISTFFCNYTFLKLVAKCRMDIWVGEVNHEISKITLKLFSSFLGPKICKKHIYCCFEIWTNQGPILTLQT